MPSQLDEVWELHELYVLDFERRPSVDEEMYEDIEHSSTLESVWFNERALIASRCNAEDGEPLRVFVDEPFPERYAKNIQYGELVVESGRVFVGDVALHLEPWTEFPQFAQGIEVAVPPGRWLVGVVSDDAVVVIIRRPDPAIDVDAQGRVMCCAAL